MKRFRSSASAWVIIALFALLVIIAMSQEAKASEYRNAEYIENYDADSITLKVWLWPGTSKKTGLYATENMRLYSVDTQ